MGDDETAIRTVVQTWISATKSRDLATILELMTDDVIFMVPGHEPFGKKAFAAGFEAMADMQINGRSDILECRLLGDWAFVRNRLEVTASLSDGGEIHREGQTLTLFQKGKDGKWRLARDANLLVQTN
jgi:uncharacterized protein (TIGR02246 family)